MDNSCLPDGFSCRQGVHRKIMQLLPYLKAIHECLQSQGQTPGCADTDFQELLFQNYRSDQNKKVSQAAATRHYKSELIISFSPLHPQQELDFWLTINLDGGGLIQVNWKWFQQTGIESLPRKSWAAVSQQDNSKLPFCPLCFFIPF